MKAHGAGNDFVLLPDLDDVLVMTPALVRNLCAPHLGLGADGVIRVAPGRAGSDAHAFMDYWNADGTAVEMCGNGIRCVAKYLADRNLAGDVVRVDSRGGVKAVRVTRGSDGRVDSARVDMGPPQVLAEQTTVDNGPASLTVTLVSMGNPHAVLVVDDVAAAPVEEVGLALQHHPAFPQGTNVEFVTAVDRGRIVGRIWERGVGETLASGTGVSAMAVAACVRGLTGRSVTVVMPGGELRVEWGQDTLHVTGPAAEVATGELDEAWLTSIC